MIHYWSHHRVADVIIAFSITVLLWKVPDSYPALAIIEFPLDGLVDLSQRWLAPILTLLGLFCATNAFMFTVVDRVEFETLLKGRSQAQMWQIMMSGIIALALAALWTLLLSLSNNAFRSQHAILYVCTFLTVWTSINVGKFIWVVTQILSVRASQATQKK